MSQIKDYVLLLIGACLTCGGLTILAPGGNFERIIRLIGSIFLLLCMISPLTDLLHNIVDYPWSHISSKVTEQSHNSWTYVEQTLEQTLTDTVNTCVNTVIGHQAKDISVEISNDNQNFVVNKIEITVYSSDSSKLSAIADYVAIKTGVRPTVICE